MENNSVAVLEYLLQIKSEKKKEPSKIERDQFYAAWVKLAVDEGYSERAERFLYNGVSYCGAKPFKGLIDEVENKEQVLNSFFAGKMHGTNAETTFRLLVHLFALLLNDNKMVDLIPVIIMRFPHACINKDKKRIGKIEPIMLKYFFAELEPKTCLVPLAELGVKKTIFIEDFISEMETILKKIDTVGLSKNKINNVDKVQQWIESYRQLRAEENDQTRLKGSVTEDVVVEEPASSVPVMSTENLIENDLPVENEKAVKSVLEGADGEHSSDMIAYLSTLLGKAGKAVSAVKSERIQQRIKIDSLTKALEIEKGELTRANQRIVDLESAIAELRKGVSDAESEIFALQKEVEKKDSIIAEKDCEIAERIKMADVLSRDRSKQADETLQRLASKIKVEYRDFADALEVPMNCDLGENLRLQLQSVFDILEKGGMKIK